MNFPFCTVFDNHTKSRILRPRFVLFCRSRLLNGLTLANQNERRKNSNILKKLTDIERENETFWMILNSEILTQKHFWLLRLAINFLSKF